MGSRSCLKQPHKMCAAVSDHAQSVPSRCLRLRHVPGSSLRLRRSNVLTKTFAARWIEEGERLLRKFVQRHGLYAAIWASAQPELAPAGLTPPTTIEGSASEIFGDGRLETL